MRNAELEHQENPEESESNSNYSDINSELSDDENQEYKNLLKLTKLSSKRPKNDEDALV